MRLSGTLADARDEWVEDPEATFLTSASKVLARGETDERYAACPLNASASTGLDDDQKLPAPTAISLVTAPRGPAQRSMVTRRCRRWANFQANSEVNHGKRYAIRIPLAISPI